MKGVFQNACGLLLLMCGVLASDRLPAQASSSEEFDTKIERTADMLMRIQALPVEFGTRAAADQAALSALAPKQDAAKVDCLRTELSREGFRKRKLAQVRAYAESDRQRFNADYAVLEGGLASLLQEFEEGRQSEISAEQADQRLAAFFSDAQFRTLRQLTGHTYIYYPARCQSCLHECAATENIRDRCKGACVGERWMAARRAGNYLAGPEPIQTSQGRDFYWWVEFLVPERDVDGDGPYRKAQILSRYIQDAT